MKPQVVAIRFIDVRSAVLIGTDPDGSRAVPVQWTGDTNASDLAVAAKASAKDAGWSMGRPVLALPTHQCIAAKITTNGLHRAGRTAGMLYRLEEFLPLDAEQVTVDFIQHRERALGVAVVTGQVRPIVDAFLNEGISFSAISPALLLAVQTAISSYAMKAGLCLMVENGQFDLIEIVDGMPIQWNHGLFELETLWRALAPIKNYENQPTIWLASDDDQAMSQLQTCGEHLAIMHIAEAPCELITQAAGDVMQRGAAPFIDLQRGQLGGRNQIERIKGPLMATATSIILLLLTLIAGNLWESRQSSAAVQDYQQQQDQLFREAFPGQNVPMGILGRLQSEKRKLAGMSGQSNQLPKWGSSLALFHQTLAALPTDLRYRLLEIRLDEQGVYLDGQARSHSDADKIAANLRNNGGFTIDAPRTENLADQGVSFTMIGKQNGVSLAQGARP